MNVLVAFEFSGIVRDAFLRRGHNAWSCDLLPTERPGPHYQCDAYDLLEESEWDLVIMHPPCTYLANSGASWWNNTNEQLEALGNIVWLMQLNCKWALENPIGAISRFIRKPDQIVQPWMFGHPETKATCFWLNDLPKLEPTEISDGRYGRSWHESPGPDRWKRRSRTLPGLATAMATQWG